MRVGESFGASSVSDGVVQDLLVVLNEGVIALEGQPSASGGGEVRHELSEARGPSSGRIGNAGGVVYLNRYGEASDRGCDLPTAARMFFCEVQPGRRYL